LHWNRKIKGVDLKLIEENLEKMSQKEGRAVIGAY